MTYDLHLDDVPGGTIDGWMHGDELKWLYETAKRMQTIVEIGSWKGRSTTALCTGCPGTVYAVDPFVGFGEQTQVDPWPTFLDHMKGFTNCIPIRCLSLDAARYDKRIPEKVDMVFIDGEHQYESVVCDVRDWWPKTLVMMAGHDRGHPGVEKAIRECFHDGVSHGPVSLWFKELIPVV